MSLSTNTLKKSPEVDRKLIHRPGRSIQRISHQVDSVMGFIKEQPLQKTKTSEIAETLDSLSIPETIQITLPKKYIQIKGRG